MFKLTDLFFENFHLLAFLHTAAHCRLPVLQALTCLLVVFGVLLVCVRATLVDNLLLEVLLLLLGELLSISRVIHVLLSRLGIGLNSRCFGTDRQLFVNLIVV